jgi:membrane peptidoglycan carboxypeptidase
MVDFATKMGISDWNNPFGYGPSVTLGGADTTMVDLTTVYSTIANSGNRVDLDPLLEVDNSNGKVLYKKHPKPVPVVNPGVAFIISSILSDNSARQIEFGLNSPLVIDGHRVSVKTGTTDNKRDNWTVGYTPNYVVATWVGNNDNSPMSQALASGITGAAPMWHDIMSNLLEGKQDSPLQIPDEIVTKKCLGTTMYFLRGTENKDRCYAPKPTPSSSPTP